MTDTPEHTQSRPDSRVVRVFISSTFRDFAEERDLLVKRVFPELRRRARDRFVEIIGVDLRWGITEEQANDGQTLPLCLREIDRARPYFIGLLGERYGWTPGSDLYPDDLLARQPWLREHAGGTSVTELEILHGVLNNPEMAGRATFYLRDPAWSAERGEDFRSEGEQDQAKLDRLKARLRESPFPTLDYETPEELADRVLEDLWATIDAEYPADDVPDELERERRGHEALGDLARATVGPRPTSLREIERRILATSRGESEERLFLLTGRSGCGLTTTLSQLAGNLANHGNFTVFSHHAEATAKSASLSVLMSRILDLCKGGSPDQSSPSSLREAIRELPTSLAALGVRQRSSGGSCVLILDGIDRLDSPSHQPWLPHFLPDGIIVIASSSDSATAEHFERDRNAIRITIDDLSFDQRRSLLKSALERLGKSLESAQIDALAASPVTATPSGIRDLANELNLTARFDSLSATIEILARIGDHAELLTLAVERVIEFIGASRAEAALTGILLSRRGMSFEELRGFSSFSPIDWARIEAVLGPNLAEADGLTRPANARLSVAIERSFGLENGVRGPWHARLAEHWIAEGPSPRSAFDLGWQLERAGRREALRSLLLDRQWIDCLLDHRPEEEILATWLAAADGHTPDLSAEYGSAIATWPGGLAGQSASLTGRLGGLISEASGPSLFTCELLMHSTNARRLEAGPPESIAIELNNLGHELLGLARHTEAVVAFEEALEIRRKHLPDSHPNLLGTIDNLGLAHAECGNRSDALACLRSALALRLEHLGPNDPDTSTSRNNLAMTLIATTEATEADCTEAMELLEVAYACSLRSLGPRHPDTGISAGNLGLAHVRIGDELRGMRLLREAIDIHRRTLGPEHPQVMVGEHRLAHASIARGIRARDEGRLDEAASILGEALAGLHGGDPMMRTAAASPLAETFARMGRRAEAIVLFRECLEIRTAELGDGHRLTRLVADRLAQLEAIEGPGENPEERSPAP